MSDSKLKRASREIADAIALAHFLVANLIFALGVFAPKLFNFMDTKQGAVLFIKTYISAPAIPVLKWILIALEGLTDGIARGINFLTAFLMADANDPRLQDATKSGFLFVDRFFTDSSAWGIFLSTEAVIILASILYWLLCYLSARLVFEVMN